MNINEINKIFAKSPLPYWAGDKRNAGQYNGRDFRKELPTAEDVYEAARLVGVKTGNLDNANREQLDSALSEVQETVLNALLEKIHKSDKAAIVHLYVALTRRADAAKPHDSASCARNTMEKLLKDNNIPDYWAIMLNLTETLAEVAVDAAFIGKHYLLIFEYEFILKNHKMHFSKLLPFFARRGNYGYNGRRAIDAAIACCVQQPNLSAWAQPL